MAKNVHTEKNESLGEFQMRKNHRNFTKSPFWYHGSFCTP